MVNPHDIEFNLKDYIKDNYKSMYNFSLVSNVPYSKVSYWCNKEWVSLTLTTRKKIVKELNHINKQYIINANS